MQKIFVSYRRADSAAICGRICDRLQEYFGDGNVFFDIESISPGVDYRTYIAEALNNVDVMVAIIGPRWAGSPERKGWLDFTPKRGRRIDDKADLVRLEVETAIERGIPIIPALIENAKAPDVTKLPESVKKLANINCTNIDEGADFNAHIRKLIVAIDYHIGGRSAKGTGRQRRAKARTKQIIDHMEGSLDNYVIRYGVSRDVVGINLIARMDFPQELILSRQEIGRWLKSYKGIFRVAVKVDDRSIEQEVVGYYAIFPLQLDTYEKLKNHEIDEKSIKLEDFKPLYSKQTEALYVLDLAKHQEEAIGAALLRDLVRYLSHITQKNKAIQKIGTWAYSEAGQGIASRLGMEHIKDYEDYEGTSFYEVSEPAAKLSAASDSSLIHEIVKVPFEETHKVMV
jgi:hypothetical protein